MIIKLNESNNDASFCFFTIEKNSRTSESERDTTSPGIAEHGFLEKNFCIQVWATRACITATADWMLPAAVFCGGAVRRGSYDRVRGWPILLRMLMLIQHGMHARCCLRGRNKCLSLHWGVMAWQNWLLLQLRKTNSITMNWMWRCLFQQLRSRGWGRGLVFHDVPWNCTIEWTMRSRCSCCATLPRI